MTALILGFLAILLAVLGSWLIPCIPRAELPWLSSSCAILVLISSIAASAAWLAGERSGAWSLAGFAWHLDALSATLLPTMALASWALILVTPKRDIDPDHKARVLACFAAAQATVLAANAMTLIACELVGLFIAFRIVRAQRNSPLDALTFGTAAASFVAAYVSLTEAGLERLDFSQLSSHPIPNLAIGGLALAAALRLGIPPLCSWLTSLLGRSTLSQVLVLALPLGGLPALARIIEPAFARPDAHGPQLALPLLLIAFVSAGIALTQRQLSRSFAFTALAILGLTMVGVMDPNPVGFAGGTLLWSSSLVALTGLGLVVVVTNSRLGSVDLSRYHGLVTDAPTLALACLVMGLANAGVPGSVEFAAADLLFHGSVEHDFFSLAILASTVSILGFNALRIFFKVFYGPRPERGAGLDLLPHERLAFAATALVLLLGGLAPNLIPLLLNR